VVSCKIRFVSRFCATSSTKSGVSCNFVMGNVFMRIHREG
jgi:hypothetical protein